MFEIAQDTRTQDAYRAAHVARGHMWRDFIGWMKGN